MSISSCPWAAALFAGLIALAAPAAASDPATAAKPALSGKAAASTADHGKFKELQGPFTSGPQVTKACLSCHTQAAKQIHKTKHWTWLSTTTQTGKPYGKRNAVNNFCGTTVSNEQRCSQCHIGYGMKDQSFDFTDETAVDCLVCHDTTGGYKKDPTGAGHPVYKETRRGDTVIPPPDLAKIAQAIGPTSRQTCGTCHFLGGGGNAVKHGDLDLSMVNPGAYLDVHMSPKRLNFSCSVCHGGEGHVVQGGRYANLVVDKTGIDIPGRSDGSRASCVSCHGDRPMKDAKLNDHTDKLACQTCHVPHFARGGFATKMLWDWSSAGQLRDGKPYADTNLRGHETYASIKGSFEWAEDVVPEYVWYNGSQRITTADDKVDATKPVKINAPMGTPGAADSRIYPFKLMRGAQAYDPENKTLALVHTWGPPGDTTAFWSNFKWEPAIRTAMAAGNKPFSGQVGFVRTESYWPIAHMVAPKDDSVPCIECHASERSRMANVPGVYMPGRDKNPVIDRIGWSVALLTLLGVVGHGSLRIVMHYRRRGN